MQCGSIIGGTESVISLLCPTRKRPEQLRRMWNSARTTADGPLELIVYIDDDDDSYKVLDPVVKVVSGPRIVLSKMWNKCYDQSIGDILMHCGDDIVFRTAHWDTIVRGAIEQYPDRIAFVYGNDGSGVHDGHFGTHGFVHRNWVATVGYFVPPYFVSDWNDSWLNDVARSIDRHIWVPIVTSHEHYVFGKAAYDSTYREREERGREARVDEIYNSKGAEREADAAKLKDFICKSDSLVSVS